MPQTETTTTSTETLAELTALKAQVEQLGERIEVQGAVQFEIAKLLQTFHGQLQDLPNQVADIVKKAIEESAQNKVPLTREVLTRLDLRLNQLAISAHTVKQVSNMTLRRLGPSTEKIRCVFIVQSIPMWDSFAEIYQAMVEDERFYPIVVSIDKSELGRAEFAGEDDVHLGLTALKIPHLRLNVDAYDALDIFRNLMPDVVFRQQQWETPVPPGLRTLEISFARICVVPYGVGTLANPDMTDESDEAYDNNYDQQYHRFAWKVFCETELTISYYGSFAHSDPEKFVLSGYPKLDKLLSARGHGVWPIPEPKGRTFRVIWAPHYLLAANGNSGFGVFHRIYKEMLEWARSSTDIQFVFKPHPSLKFSLSEGSPLANGGYQQYVDTWSALSNCAVSEGTYGELFEASDLMLTDGVSFLSEYQLFEKPLIYFDSGNHPPFNSLGRMAERASHKVETFNEMRKAALEYKAGRAWALEAERQAFLKVLLPCEQPAARIILDSIAADIHAPKA
ncbi:MULTISPECIES: CDP-glycerol glycerophosphotransferase family protein [unclassified Rhizobium]|uniref:CDP-glycerol glycerophosphotransferase family protein n=1 Tax=unclassified Rhizobium TaxID=2613769 RepID=UPI001ADA7F07|nr:MULTISPECIES: CDP-glycerol glycerophosphotransferase family protein [unclassified Rhizobium]MBO9122781.1 CDP-glycerol glycerophosphotransferase family protein [Rhizobium sp. 16-488-2b]MBO9173313.1 CDP-glycerol glycerophosphotransferase family protein [Rhizobium sp. 16-488-2a]